MIEEYAPHLQSLAVQIHDIDPDLAQTLHELASGKAFGFTNLREYLRGRSMMQKPQLHSVKPSKTQQPKPAERPALRKLLDMVVEHAQKVAATKKPPASPLIQ